MEKPKYVSKRKYIKQGRLADVIALISFLSLGDYAFCRMTRLCDELRGEPISLGTWGEIAVAHNEFFRLDGSKERVGLIIRAALKEDEHGRRAVLSVSEIQALINTAISLNDKEMAFMQKNTYLFPFWATLIASVLSTITTITISIINNNNDANIIKSLNLKMQTIEQKLDKLSHFQGK